MPLSWLTSLKTSSFTSLPLLPLTHHQHFMCYAVHACSSTTTNVKRRLRRNWTKWIPGHAALPSIPLMTFTSTSSANTMQCAAGDITRIGTKSWASDPRCSVYFRRMKSVQTGFVSVAGLCVVVLVCWFVMSSGTHRWCVAYSCLFLGVQYFVVYFTITSYFWSVFFHGFGF